MVNPMVNPMVKPLENDLQMMGFPHPTARGRGGRAEHKSRDGRHLLQSTVARVLQSVFIETWCCRFLVVYRNLYIYT